MRINYKEPNAIDELSCCLAENVKKPNKALIFCVGTDKSIGDCLGPLVGTLLANKGLTNPIVGTLQNPAHAMNLDTVIKNTKKQYPEHFIIAIDACLGYEGGIGDIQINNGPVHPGKGVKKKLEDVGDISIVGVVDTLENSDLFSIKNIRLGFIMSMAEIIAESIIRAVGRG